MLERQEEKQVGAVCPLVWFPNVCDSRDWVRLKLGARSSVRVSPREWWRYSYMNHLLLPPRAHFNRRQKQDSDPSTPTQEASIPGSILTMVPDAHP